MLLESTERLHQTIRDALLSGHSASGSSKNQAPAAGVVAAIHCCEICEQWWVNSEEDRPGTHLIWRFVEPYSSKYLWQDYKGWRKDADPKCCPTCDRQTPESDCVLRMNEEGKIVWPESQDQDTENAGQEEENPFVSYVAQSKKMSDNITVIAAWEARHEANAKGFTADINDMREEMNEMRIAFKDVVYSYSPLLPPGWRVTGDYGAWLKGEACAGFLHGEMRPDTTLMIGGRCSSVAELEIELDRLFRYVSDLTF